MICEFIHCLHLQRPLLRFEAHVSVSACVDEEQCALYGGVDMVVVCEPCHGQPVIPIILSFTHKDSQILLQLLVVEFAHELGNKLRSTIRYN